MNVDSLLNEDFSLYSKEELEMLYAQVKNKADESCYSLGIQYNIKDVSLVEQLNAKSRLIEMALTLAYDNKTNYADVFTQVRMWDVKIGRAHV